MTQVNLHEAKARLSHYARRVKAGETIILCERNHPFAEIRPLPEYQTKRTRKLGQMRGMAPVGEAFFQADSEIEKFFTSGSLEPHKPEGR